MADRGSELCRDDDGYFLWKRCEIEGCPNVICGRRSPLFCWPHSDSGKTLEEVMQDIAEPLPALAPIEAQRGEDE